jgi:hypothetical protein
MNKAKKLYPAPHPDAIFEDEEEQTFEDFVEMGKRKPNIHGTGRWKLNAQRKQLCVYNFSSSSRSSNGANGSHLEGVSISQQVEFLVAYLENTLCLEVNYVECLDALNLATSTFQLDDLEYDIIVTKPKKKRKRNEIRDIHVDVFSLFDVLVQKAKSPYISIIGLFDCILSEDGNEVLGRACGDRVSCVSLASADNIKSLMCTTAHELLHTIGFDHCTSERCIMNAIGYEDWLFLGSINMLKLDKFHEEGKSTSRKTEPPSTDRTRYYGGLLELLDTGDPQLFSKDKLWLQQAIDYWKEPEGK